ncbi:membrane protein insertase YidC, partial [Pelagibacterales bacterium SAG-MED43]|nr:membrane protein insertase YidC [Pelagibacterales bacterium SAG-MED43]
MDTKNVVAAISLSAAVIVLYSLFFVPDPTQRIENLSKKDKIEKNSDTPSLEQKETLVKISRDEAINQSDRVNFENDNIIGSISLKGAIIDDLTFKKYNTELESNENVVLLNPRNVDDGYFIENGFVTTDKNIDIPNSDTGWSIEGNNKLTEKNPIKLTWTNDQGIEFIKEISLDNKFLFKIKQKIINSTNKEFDFYSYGQIIRNKIPEGLSNFY